MVIRVLENTTRHGNQSCCCDCPPTHKHDLLAHTGGEKKGEISMKQLWIIAQQKLRKVKRGAHQTYGVSSKAHDIPADTNVWDHETFRCQKHGVNLASS